MIVEFEDEYLLKLYQGKAKGKPKFSQEVIKQFKKTVDKLKLSAHIEELKMFKSLNFEALQNNYYSVRVNKQYRLILTVEGDRLEIIIIHELSKHYE